MLISVTEIMGFMRCRRQWDYTSFSRQSLGPIVPNRALSLGKTMHRAWAQWLVEPDAEFSELFLHAAAQELEAIKEAYLAAVGAPVSEQELGEYYDGVDLGHAMARNYYQKWGTPLPEGFSIVRPEQQIEVPIPGTEWPHIHISDLAHEEWELHLDRDHVGDHLDDEHEHWVNLSARLDAIIRRDSTGELFILEHKTFAARPKAEVLQSAFQFVAYEWAAQQLGIGRIAGTAYDGCWKRSTPPRGSTFDDLFTRVLITHPQEQLDDFQQTLIAIANEMQNGPAIYPNRRWEGCFDCQYNRLCTAQSRGEDIDSIKQHDFMRLDQDKEPVIESE